MASLNMAATTDSSGESTLPAWVEAKLEPLNGVELTLEPQLLRIRDERADAPAPPKKKSKLLRVISRSTNARNWTIPYYDILWAEVSTSDNGPILTIDYTFSESRNKLRPESLTFELGVAFKNDDAAAGAAYDWVKTLMDRAYGQAMRRKRAFVLINPHSGPGGAVKKWESKARPIFERARMELNVVLTTHQGHATELMSQIDIAKFDIIIVCSGDGLVYEVFNGLGKRADARLALNKLAVCHIPCGSGNAMACNVYGTHHPSPAALAIVKGLSTQVDLVSITQGETRTLSFLSQALGIIAEADLGTEWLRFLGPFRFTLGVLFGFMMAKTYPCDIAVKVEVATKAEIKQHYRNKRRDCSFESLQNGGSSPRTTNGDVDGSTEGDGLPSLQYGTVNDELPEGWELVSHPNMGNFYCGNMAFMEPDAPFFAASLINDGLMDLVYVDGKHGFWKYIQMFGSVGDGGFFDNPLVSYRKVSAYRLIPRQPAGYIDIDGERIPFQPWQAEVHAGLGTVLTKRGMFEHDGPPGLPSGPSNDSNASKTTL